MTGQTAKDLVHFHFNRYPKAEPRDFYKLIYQGVFGVGHLISSKAYDYLVEEANRVDLADYPDRELIEPVSEDGLMVRVYLRPFMRAGLSLDKLFEVMKRSSEIEGDMEQFMSIWKDFAQMVKDGQIPVPENKMGQLLKLIEEEGIKPMHHTESYRDAYYPAYRVVWKPFLDEEFGEL